MRVKCLAQEHNTMSPARARTRSARSGVERANHEATVPPTMAYYKDPNFDPKKKLRVIYNKQPAADTGGVTRQFFTQLLHLMFEVFSHGDYYKIST